MNDVRIKGKLRVCLFRESRSVRKTAPLAKLQGENSEVVFQFFVIVLGLILYLPHLLLNEQLLTTIGQTLFGLLLHQLYYHYNSTNNYNDLPSFIMMFR